MNYVYFGTIQMRKYCFIVENVENSTRGLRHLALHSFFYFFGVTIDSQEVHRNKRFTKIKPNSAGCCVLFAQLLLMLKSCVTIKKQNRTGKLTVVPCMYISFSFCDTCIWVPATAVRT